MAEEGYQDTGKVMPKELYERTTSAAAAIFGAERALEIALEEVAKQIACYRKEQDESWAQALRELGLDVDPDDQVIVRANDLHILIKPKGKADKA